MKVVELKVELKKRGLKSSGNKAELEERLATAGLSLNSNENAFINSKSITNPPRSKPTSISHTVKKIIPEQEIECSICWTTLGENNKVVTKCGHVFCMDCTMKHTNTILNNRNKCPMCRSELFTLPKTKKYVMKIDGVNVDLKDILTARDYDFFVDLIESIPENNIAERNRIFVEALRNVR